jgi:cysteine-rich repeat protein
MVTLKGKVFIIALVFLGLAISSNAMALTCSVPSGSYTTIQSAVNDTNCDTINVSTGTYNETVNIDGRSNLNIVGVDKTTTIIQPSSTLCWNVASYGCARGTAFRVVNSTGIVLTNMTMDFNLVKANNVAGVLYWDSTGTLNNNIIENMSLPDASGGYYEITSYVRAPSYTPASRAQVSFVDNTFIDTGRLCIVTHDYVNTTISGNTFYKTTDDFGYAMEIGSQSTATVSNNTIYGYDTPAASDGSQSAGIYIENSFTGPLFGPVVTGVTKNVAVSNNEIYDCQWALYVGNEFDGYAGDVDIAVNVLNNNLHDNIDGAVLLTDEDKQYGSSVKATFNGNTISNNGGYGVYIYTQGDGDVQANLPNDTITGHDVGVYLEDTAAGLSNSSYNIAANMNNISGNASYGVQNTYSGTIIDAKYNWWGCAAGPGNTGCDNVSINVDYTPWLTSQFPDNFYWKDYNGEDPGGYMPDIDQNQDFDKVIVRTEETDLNVSCQQAWLPYPDSHASGGSITYSDTATDSCTFTFTGTSIRYIGTPSNNKGIASVYIDDQYQTDVDLYSATLKYQQVLYTNNNLAAGPHTIKIVVTGNKNPLSSLQRIDVDAFDVDDIEKEYCAPVAETNSLWWLDKAHGLGIFEFPEEGEGYIGGDINGDGIADILDLVQDLAVLMKTNVGHTGTLVGDEQDGIEAFFDKYPQLQLGNKLYEHTIYPGDYTDWLPFFSYIEAEVERSQDVKLDLGFWHVDEAIPMGPGMWQVTWSRRGGHAVTVAGVDSQNLLLAISDPDNNTAENGGLGVIRPLPGGHLPHPNDSSVHNNEINVSHDIYTVGLSPSPGSTLGLLNFPWKWNLPEGEWEVIGPVIVEWPEPLEYSMTFTEVEAAVIVSPIICGNGVVDPGEECDDGNLIPGDGCSPVCKLEVCGNSILDPGEECDDGNTNNGDGCDEFCKIPDISVSPSSLTFGKVIAGSLSTNKTVTVSNTGNGELTIGTITIAGTNPSQFSITTDNCSGQLIAPSGSCTVDVKFSPTSTGKKTATLEIPSDDPDAYENPASVSLKGNGVKVIVTSPNGGESWKSRDGGYPITWLTSGTIGSVATTKIFYTMNGGTTWKLISSFSGNPGSYTWYIPKVSVTKNKCKVKVVLKNSANKTLGSDKSDKKFTITP